MPRQLKDMVVLVKGGGEVASAIAHKLSRSHFRVCLTEVSQPIAVSRGVAFCEAIYDGEKEVEGVVARRVASAEEVAAAWRENKLPILVDPEAKIKNHLHSDVIVDAIMAKKNLNTKMSDAPLVIGLGPGFSAGIDVHVVIETNESENLGNIITSGGAEPDTGTPLNVGGLTEERVLRSPTGGRFRSTKKLGDPIAAGDTVGWVDNLPVRAKIDGVLRALIRDGLEVAGQAKLGEVDPRGNRELYKTIRPRMRAIAGGVLEAILTEFNG
jgi:xanthine dehydrogenase accessory factor